VDKNETLDSSPCVGVRYVPEGKGELEVGWHKYGLHCGFTFDYLEV
jgi:hypothetical protein